MLVTAAAGGLLGVVVGLYRRIGTLWLLLALSILLVPTGLLLTGGATLAAFVTTATWVVALQIGYMTGLLIRWQYVSVFSTDRKAEYGENGTSAERPNAKTSTN